VQAIATRRLRVLFADDEPHLRELLQTELSRLGHYVTVCPDGPSALKALEKGSYDAAILDIRMPGMSGLEVLMRMKQIAPNTEAILLTGHASLESAVEALRLGAFEYITKPCKLAEIEAVLRRIAEKKELTLHNLALQRRLRAAEGPTVLIGESPPMQQVRPPDCNHRPYRRHGADFGRDRHRQGTGGPHHLRTKPACCYAFCSG
jgi:DNA-binding NtrC family response regulator